MDAPPLPPLQPTIPRSPVIPRHRLLHSMSMLIPSRRPSRTHLLALNHSLMRNRNLIIPLPPSIPITSLNQNLLITPHRRRMMMHRRPKPTQPPTPPPTAAGFRTRFRLSGPHVVRGKRVIALAPPSTGRTVSVAAWPAVAE